MSCPFTIYSSGLIDYDRINSLLMAAESDLTLFELDGACWSVDEINEELGALPSVSGRRLVFLAQIQGGC